MARTRNIKRKAGATSDDAAATPSTKKARTTRSNDGPIAAQSNVPDRATFPGWVEMESEPAFFNVMLSEMGVKGVKVQEVFSTEPQIMALLPQPVHALIFLFKYMPSDEQKLDQEPDSEDVWFANQVPDFACASVALLNIVNNIPALELSKELQDFKEATQERDQVTRGQMIDNFEFIKRIHNSFATDEDLVDAEAHAKEKAAKLKRQEAAAKGRATKLAKKAAQEAAAQEDAPAEPAKRPSRTTARSRQAAADAEAPAEAQAIADMQAVEDVGKQESTDALPMVNGNTDFTKAPVDDDAEITSDANVETLTTMNGGSKGALEGQPGDVFDENSARKEVAVGEEAGESILPEKDVASKPENTPASKLRKSERDDSDDENKPGSEPKIKKFKTGKFDAANAEIKEEADVLLPVSNEVTDLDETKVRPEEDGETFSETNVKTFKDSEINGKQHTRAKTKVSSAEEVKRRHEEERDRLRDSEPNGDGFDDEDNIAAAQPCLSTPAKEKASFDVIDGENVTSVTKPRRSTRSKKPPRRDLSSIKPADEYDEAGFHFVAYLPVNNRVWKLDGLDKYPTDVGTFGTDSSTNADGGTGNWIDAVMPSIIGRMADFEGNQIQFNLMAVVHDPYFTDRKDLVDNIKVLRTIHAELSDIVEDWYEMDGAETGRDVIVGPSAEFDISQTAVDRVMIEPDQLIDLEKARGDLYALLELRKKILLRQSMLRGSLRVGLRDAKEDFEKAEMRRGDHRRYMTTKSSNDAAAESEKIKDSSAREKDNNVKGDCDGFTDEKKGIANGSTEGKA